MIETDQDEFPVIKAIPRARYESPLPPRVTLYFIIGVWRDRWAIPAWASSCDRDGAESLVQQALQRGWSHVRIVEIPGEDSEAETEKESESCP